MTIYIESLCRDPEVVFVEDVSPSRLAFRMTPATVRALVPSGVPGTYLLLSAETPVYVGRSDKCLQSRLASHNHLEVATHVLWEPAKDPWQAFLLESWWWHRHSPYLNRIHPATPSGGQRRCPFCEPGISLGLKEALSYPPIDLNLRSLS